MAWYGVCVWGSPDAVFTGLLGIIGLRRLPGSQDYQAQQNYRDRRNHRAHRITGLIRLTGNRRNHRASGTYLLPHLTAYSLWLDSGKLLLHIIVFFGYLFGNRV
ncbi:hypothetical protein BZA77DRAFT_304630 [Pyronema omphalodes]|nr:hypothetical protein BZA77DRAFT_304630 [Pyronema omphalodes]